MKTLLNPKSFAAIAALFVTTVLALATPAGAKELKIHGVFDGFETRTPMPPSMLVQLEEVGNASHFGRFFMDLESLVSLATLYGEGDFEIRTNCGGTIYGVQAGQGRRTSDPAVVAVDSVLTITGGTGRFEGATGTLYANRFVTGSMGINWGTIEGVVVLP